MGFFDRAIIALRRVAVAAQHRQPVTHRRDVALDIAGVGQTSDSAQGQLFPAAGDHHWRPRLLDRFRFEDRALDVEIPSMECRPRLSPHLQDQLDRFLHLPDSCRRLRRELPAILPIFILEKTGADAERQPAPADQVDARRDLGEMRGIAITDRGGQGCQTDAAGDGSQPRKDGPTFQDRLVRRAHAGDLDHVVQDREPGKAVGLRPFRLRLHRLECLGRIGSVEPGRLMDAEFHQWKSREAILILGRSRWMRLRS